MLPQGSVVSSVLGQPCTSVPGSGSSQLEDQLRPPLSPLFCISFAPPLLQCMRCGVCEHSLWARSAGPRLFWLWISKLMWGKQRFRVARNFLYKTCAERVRERRETFLLCIYLLETSYQALAIGSVLVSFCF